MDRLSFTVLGGFQAQLPSGRVLSLPSRKARALLAYLALVPGQAHPRDKLAALLWGESTDERARHSLRQALVSIRDGLRHAAPGALLEEGETVALNADAADVDVETFRRLARTGTTAALEGAARLYRGDLLEGLDVVEPSFEDWLLTERERLREMALEVLARLLAQQNDAGAIDGAIETAVKLLGLDAAQEAVHRSLMRLYVRQGRRGAALRQYQGCVSALERELGVEPEAETKRLYQEVLRSRRVLPRESETSPRQPRESRPSGDAPDPPAPLPSRADVPTRETPLIGRGPDLERLRVALRAVEARHGRVVVVLGEAGVGKSSVLQSLVAEAVEHGARVLLGRSYESEQVLPFGPWLDALRGGGVAKDAAVLERLGPVWRTELARLLPEIEHERSEHGDDRSRLFESVAQLVAVLAADGPVVLALEDLHWADEMSLRLLSFLARRLQPWAVLVVVTAREEEIADRPTLRLALDELQREPHVDQLTLSPLSRESITSLVRSLVRVGGDAEVTARVEETVWKASEGNPFVAGEIVRALQDGTLAQPSTTLALPPRVRELTARRLERLSERGRRLTAVAAVIGREFEFALLQRATDLDEPEAADGLEELVRRRVLHGVGERFDFVHDRIRDVAYGEVLPPRRRLLHAAVGAALEGLYAQNLEPHYAALGTHYREGEKWDKAVVYCRHAGVQAGARSALAEARTWLDQALDALAKVPESRSTLEQAVDIRLDLRPVLYQLGEARRTLERLREAEALAEKLSDDRRRCRVYAFVTNMHTLLGALDEARTSGTRALEIAREVGDLELQILSTTFLGQVHHYQGEYERQVDVAIGNLAALPADWVYKNFGIGAPVSTFDRVTMVISLTQLGRFTEAAEYEAEVIRLAEPTHHPYTIGQAHMAGAVVNLLKGDWAKARSLAERSVAVLRRGNVVHSLFTAIAASAWALAQLGEASEVLGRLREGEQFLARHESIGGLRPWAYHALGRACLLVGRLDDARRLCDRAIESSPPGYVADALHLAADLACHPDRFDAERGEAHYRKALALAGPRGMRPLVAHCHRGLGKLHERAGHREQAQEHLGTARAMYREMGMQFWLDVLGPSGG